MYQNVFFLGGPLAGRHACIRHCEVYYAAEPATPVMYPVGDASYEEAIFKKVAYRPIHCIDGDRDQILMVTGEVEKEGVLAHLLRNHRP